MNFATIMEVIKLAHGAAMEIIPMFVNKDDSGNVTGVTAIVFLEKAGTKERNEEILRKIAEANAAGPE